MNDVGFFGGRYRYLESRKADVLKKYLTRTLAPINLSELDHHPSLRSDEITASTAFFLNLNTFIYKPSSPLEIVYMS